MKINCLKRHSAATIKALFGLPPKVLAEVLFLTLPALENERTERLKNRQGRKRRFQERDGRPREVQPYQKVLMGLLYLRHNTSHEIVGRMFSKRADTSENAFVEVLPVLCALTKLLQLSHVHSNVETLKQEEIEKALAQLASIEPRSFKRGNELMQAPASGGGANASIEPRSFKRGNLRGAELNR